jgi:hypothetical protein
MNISADTRLDVLLETYPECLEFLWPFRALLSSSDTVAELAEAARYTSAPFVSGLMRYVERATQHPFDRDELRVQLIKPGCVNVAGFVDFVWQDAFRKQLRDFAAAEGFALNINLFPKHQKKQFQNYIARCERAEDLPEILIGKGFSSFMTQQFIDRFVRSGDFAHPLDVPYSPAFEAAGLRDADHGYHVFGADEYVMVYDPVVDPDCPEPQHWRDLQNSCYFGKITQMGKSQRDHFGFAQLFFLSQVDGEAGVLRYARNVKRQQHFTKIVKNMAIPGSDALPVSVLHQYAARFIRSDARDVVTVIRPSEGNPVTARYFLLKKEASPEAVRLAMHLYEEPGSDLLTQAGMIPACAADCRIRWVGWDALKQAPLPFLKDALSELVYGMKT